MTNATLQKEIAAMKADIRELKRAAKASADVAAARERLRAKILEGLESGPAEEITPAFWKKMRAYARKHARRA
jgi:hypothetical protein